MGKQYRHLALEERCAIAGLRAAGQSVRQIAAALDRSASTIARELRRNSPERGGYRPAYADEQAWARRWRGARMARQPDLQHHVLGHLAMGWSPEQIAGRLAHEKASMRISHETIYRFVYDQIRRTNDYRWRHYLPRAKSRRGWRRRPHRPMDHIKHRVSLTERPACADTRPQRVHWEAYLVHPRNSSAAVPVAH